MTKHDTFIVTVKFNDGEYSCYGQATFNRMPTNAEVLESFLKKAAENDAILPRFSDDILKILIRGIPTPNAEIVPETAAVLEYADGWVRVIRSERWELEDIDG